MANFIISYDITSPMPTHNHLEQVFEQIGATAGRIQNSVWYVAWSGTPPELFEALQPLFSSADRLIIVEAADAKWRNLMIKDQSLRNSWDFNRNAVSEGSA